jgi:aspartate-semialdehyde dehydrogenase
MNKGGEMSEKLSVGVIGATGMVGQNYIRLLKNHPWFEVVYLAASPRSAGKKYSDAVAGRWQMSVDIPEQVRDIEVKDASNVEGAIGQCSLIFSAVDMEKQAVAALESEYASKGFAVVSNNSAHRHTDNVPMLIPEINAAHIEIIPEQQKRYGWDRGLIAVKPNCSIQSYMLPLYALLEAGYAVDKMIVSTLQALSGAGYPGPSAMDMIDNVVPYISGEEEKSEIEPAKILGRIRDGRFVPDESIKISAHCNRVPVVDGHIACASLNFSDKKPEIEDIIEIWENFRAVPQELELPSAPVRPLIYRHEIDRPQPRKDRDTDKGMAVSVGRLRPCNVFDYRFVGLHHNTVRGAAGGSILIAELLKAKGYLA